MNKCIDCGIVISGTKAKKRCGSAQEKTGCAYLSYQRWKSKYQRTYRHKNREQGREHRRSYYYRNKEKIANYLRQWHKLYGRKQTKAQQRAHNAVYYAIKSGKPKKPIGCSACGSSKKRIDGHHKDYSKPLEVVWLCQPCHGKEHRMGDIEI